VTLVGKIANKYEIRMRLLRNGEKPLGSCFYERSGQQLRFDLGNLKLVRKNVSEENKKLRYLIEVECPQIEGSSDPKIEKFNRQVLALAIERG
jgi:hypothetical protein